MPSTFQMLSTTCGEQRVAAQRGRERAPYNRKFYWAALHAQEMMLPMGEEPRVTPHLLIFRQRNKVKISIGGGLKLGRGEGSVGSV